MLIPRIQFMLILFPDNVQPKNCKFSPEVTEKEISVENIIIRLIKKFFSLSFTKKGNNFCILSFALCIILQVHFVFS